MQALQIIYLRDVQGVRRGAWEGSDQLLPRVWVEPGGLALLDRLGFACFLPLPHLESYLLYVKVAYELLDGSRFHS